MELRDWAIHILSADVLEEKLFYPERLTDHQPGSPLFWKEPIRPIGMGFKRHTKKERLPSIHEHGELEKRAVCLHRFAGHELLAVEMMAYALLAFPEAPKHFRRGVANTLREEQWHVRLYINRLKEMGVCFGDFPLYRHFWAHTPFITSPLRYLSLMSLTFEMANLDFAPIYGQSFAKHGDEKSAALMKTILEDEISHVSFGLQWLKKLKEKSKKDWDVWRESIPEIVSPKRARGNQFFEEHRQRAGVSEEWIQKLRNYS